jgi:hypothetical protein
VISPPIQNTRGGLLSSRCRAEAQRSLGSNTSAAFSHEMQPPISNSRGRRRQGTRVALALTGCAAAMCSPAIGHASSPLRHLPWRRLRRFEAGDTGLLGCLRSADEEQIAMLQHDGAPRPTITWHDRLHNSQ